LIEYDRATLSAVIAYEKSGRSSIPETPAMKSKSRGVLDTPLCARMTIGQSAACPPSGSLKIESSSETPAVFGQSGFA
jgi:hypothetical protein